MSDCIADVVVVLCWSVKIYELTEKWAASDV